MVVLNSVIKVLLWIFSTALIAFPVAALLYLTVVGLNTWIESIPLLNLFSAYVVAFGVSGLADFFAPSEESLLHKLVSLDIDKVIKPLKKN